jgi:hypothetical protein
MAEQTTVVHGETPLQVAFDYAQQEHLPLGSQVEVTDVNGEPQHFTVMRSGLSKHMHNGGEIQLAKTPKQHLTGGGDPLEQDYVIHASSPAEAAMLFAREAGLASKTHVKVSSMDHKQHQYYRSPEY